MGKSKEELEGKKRRRHQGLMLEVKTAVPLGCVGCHVLVLSYQSRDFWAKRVARKFLKLRLRKPKHVYETYFEVGDTIITTSSRHSMRKETWMR